MTPSPKALKGSEQFQDDCTSENFVRKRAVSQIDRYQWGTKRNLDRFYVNSVLQDQTALEFEYALLFNFIILEGKFFSQQGEWPFFTVNTIDDGFFMDFFDNLITHEHDLSFGLLSSLDIHTPALIFFHLAGGTVPSSGWRDTLRRCWWEALLAQELPRSRQLRS